MIKRRVFNSSMNEVKLGIASRSGGSAAIKIPQLAWDGKDIDTEAVSKQAFILDSDGKNNLKIRGAYHQESPFCAYLKNEPTNKTEERLMPLPKIKLEDVDDIASAPEYVRAAVKDGKVPDWTYVKKDDEGNIVAEARELENGNWAKVEYNVPLYKQYFTDTYLPIPDDKADGADENGNYILTTSAYCYVAVCELGFFLAVEVDNAGNKVKGTEGVYMVEGSFGEKHFSKLYPFGSAAKVSVGSKINKVFNNPLLGVLPEGSLTKAGKLKKGKFRYGKATTVAILDIDGNIAQVLSDRNAYKLSDFRPKQTRAITAASEINEALKEELDTNDTADEIDSVESIENLL